MEFPPILGRLHPMVLHFPIVLVLAALVLEGLAWSGRLPRRALAPVLVLAALSAALTASTGWILSHEDGYGGARLERHEQLGIALAVLSALAAIVHGRRAAGRRLLLYRVLLLAAVGVLVPGAHLGSTLTHGIDWLQGPRPERPQASVPVAADPEAGRPPPLDTDRAQPDPAPRDPAPGAAAGLAVSTYAEVIAPILAARCTSCHGESKRKGGLRLHEPEAIERGGHDGPVLVAGDPGASLMMVRTRLPLDHEDHMPPEGKPQPSVEELDLLAAWIAAGAPFEGRVDLAQPPAGAPVAPGDPAPTQASPTGAGNSPSGTRGSVQVPPAEPGGPGPAAGEPFEASPGPPAEGLEALRALFVHVEFLERDPPRLWIDTAAAAGSLGDERLARLLEPCLPFVAELSLARTASGPRTLALLVRAPHLRRLDLRASGVSSADLEALRGHPALEELVLAQTDSSAALDVLLALPALRRVFLWHSGMGAESLARLAAARPELELSTGTEAVVAPADPPVDAPADTSGARPVNRRCPVSGEAIDPAQVLLQDGRLVAFCCSDCRARFAADPAAFAVESP